MRWPPSWGPQCRPAAAADWIDRDRALILTALLAGLRADELVRANVGDLRRSDDGAVIQVRGKGGKDRRVPIESALVQVLERYLDDRATRIPATAKRRSSPGGGLAAWPKAAPLFVGADGERVTRGTLQYGCCGRFAALASTPTAPTCPRVAPPSPPNSPTPTSASTP